MSGPSWPPAPPPPPPPPPLQGPRGTPVPAGASPWARVQAPSPPPSAAPADARPGFGGLQAGTQARPGTGGLSSWDRGGPPGPSGALQTPDTVPSGQVASWDGPGRGFPQAGPWMTFYGQAKDLGNLQDLADRYRVFNVDADPTLGNFTKDQIETLKKGGENRVMSYLNLGAAENFRSYWKEAPDGLVPAGQNQEAQLGKYDGYSDEEKWMDPANADWRALVLDHMVPKLVAQGVDGFYLDNLEVLSHGPEAKHRPLTPEGVQAGLDLVAEIRDRYPNLLIVLQNGAGPTTREGRTSDGRPFAELLDGVAHESLFTQPSEEADARNAKYRIEKDEDAIAHMKAWQAMNLRPGGRPFHLSAQEYLGPRPSAAALARVRSQARAAGFALHVGDKSAGMQSGSVVGLQERG